jgi:hypothetical protein
MLVIYGIAFLLALLPTLVAVLYRTVVVPTRQGNMQSLLESSIQHAVAKASTTATTATTSRHYLLEGQERVKATFEAVYSFTRLILPALYLSCLYAASFYLTIAVLVTPSSGPAIWLNSYVRPSFVQPFFLVYTLIGAYVFNTGVLTRRTYLLDITEHVFWGAINRVILSTGLALVANALFLSATPVPPTAGASPTRAAVTAPSSQSSTSPALNVSAQSPAAGKIAEKSAGSISTIPFRKAEFSLFFMIAFIPRIFFTYFRKKVTEKLQDPDQRAQELPLELVQGIDIWRVQRLEEEGIESIENLATADVLTLAVKTHFPLRTLIDWIDQSICIERFPETFNGLRKVGLAVSAIELAWLSPANAAATQPAAIRPAAPHMIQRPPDQPPPDVAAAITLVAKALGIEPAAAAITMDRFYNDGYVSALWSLWQNPKDPNPPAIPPIPPIQATPN